jgi:hypothetical protein
MMSVRDLICPWAERPNVLYRGPVVSAGGVDEAKPQGVPDAYVVRRMVRANSTSAHQNERDQRPIFLSFRSGDSQVLAVSLYHALTDRLNQTVMFDFLFDPVDWVGELIETVRRSALVLVLIGPKWLDILSERRESGETFSDAVHIELRAATHHAIPLLAVLVDGATLPAPSSLPQDLIHLADMPSVAVRTSSWQQDVAQLVQAIQQHRLAS